MLAQNHTFEGLLPDLALIDEVALTALRTLTVMLLCSAQIVLRAIDTLVRKQSDNVLKNGFQQVSQVVC